MAGVEGILACLDDVRWSIEVGLADRQVDDVSALRLFLRREVRYRQRGAGFYASDPL